MLALGIDLGTSGTKATLVDESGRVVASVTEGHPLHAPRPGWSEQDPEDWWRSAVAAIHGALSAPGVRAGDVAALGLAGQMHGLVMLDRAGAVLRPCILWNDQRSAPQCARLESEIGIERLVALTGNRLLPGFTAPKILWCRENEPELERAAATHLLPKDWLRYRLSGTLASEVSDASGTLLFDCAKRRWSDAMLDLLDIRRSTLPDCAESPVPTATLGADAARATGLRAGTPIVGGAGDQAATAVGAGIVDEGRVAVTIGTSGVVFAASAAWRPSRRGELHAFCHAVPGMWHVMGVMLSAGGSLRWFRDTMAHEAVARGEMLGQDPYDLLVDGAARVAPGADGLLFLPYLSGERCPHPDPAARGALVGLSSAHGLGHVARAILEGVTFGLRDNLDLVRSVGARADEALVSGGGARSAVWRQLCADVFGIPVVAARGDEGAALGAALLAGVGAAMWPDVPSASRCAAAASEAREAERVTPSADAPRYAPILERYRALYPALMPFFRTLAS